MSEISTTSGTSSKKSFWEKPEGLWGMCLVAVVGAGILWFLVWFVPLMLTLGLGLLGLGIVWGTVAFLGWAVFTNNPLRQAFVLKLQNVARKLRRAVINEDPIGILRDLITKAKKRMEEFQKLREPVKSSSRNVASAIKTYRNQLDDLQAAYNLQKVSGDAEALQRILSKIGKVDKMHTEMLNLSSDVQRMDMMLSRAGKVVNQIIEDAEFEISNEEIRLRAVTSVSSAWKKLRSVFKASVDEGDLRAEAMRAVADQCDDRLGEVDLILEEFQVVINEVNSADAINAEKARIKLTSLENNTKALEVGSPVVFNTINQKVATPVRR